MTKKKEDLENETTIIDDTAPAVVTEAKGIKPYTVKLDVSALYVRKGPGKNFEAVNTIYDGETKYMIIEESEGEGASMWGKLKTGGWISLDYVK